MSQTAAHEHPNYIALWGVLLALLFAGIGAGFLGNHVLAAVLVFGVAFVKAWIVAMNYMHLQFEPKLVKIVVLGAICIVFLVFVGLVPDIVYVYGG